RNADFCCPRLQKYPQSLCRFIDILSLKADASPMKIEETGSRNRESAEADVLDTKGNEAADLPAQAGEGAGLSGGAKRKLESRRKLMDAARRLFVERGYHDTRPQDISKAAGVGHGTFYLHFQDKLDCFLAFADEAVEELDAFLIKPAGDMDIGSTEEIISKNLRAIMIYSDAHPGVLPAATTDLTVLSTGDIGNRTPA